MLEVRPLAPEEWPLLKDLRLRALAEAPEAFSTTLAQAHAWTDAEWQARAERFRSLPPAAAYVALVDGSPCGLLTCYLSEDKDGTGGLVADLNAFWVDPAHRGQGIGEALAASVTQWAARQGAPQVQAWVMEDSPRALGFYKKVGFQETGKRQPLAPDTTRHIVLLVKQIITD